MSGYNQDRMVQKFVFLLVFAIEMPLINLLADKRISTRREIVEEKWVLIIQRLNQGSSPIVSISAYIILRIYSIEMQ